MSRVDVYHHKGSDVGCLTGMIAADPWGSLIGMILGAIWGGVYIWNSPHDGIFEFVFWLMLLVLGVSLGGLIGIVIGVLVNLLIVKIIDMNKMNQTIKVGDKEMKIKDVLHKVFGEHVNSIKDLRKRDRFYEGDDAEFMKAITLCHLPVSAINPMTGKVYTCRELADEELVMAWFFGPREVMDYSINRPVPYKK